MNKIRLPRDGAEYAHFTFSPTPGPGVLLEAEVGGVWYGLDVTGAEPRLLLKGPDLPTGAPGVRVTKDGPIRVRLTESPEVVVRGAGYVALVS